METAIAGGVRGVILVNPDFRANTFQQAQGDESDLRRKVQESPAKWYSSLEKQRFLWPVARRFPDFVWRIINSLGLATSRADTLVRLSEANVETVLVSDGRQAESYVRGRKGRIRRISADGALTIARIDPLDHSCFGPVARHTVSDLLTSWLEVRYAICPDLTARKIQHDAKEVAPPLN
jgi:hypothetical protein